MPRFRKPTPSYLHHKQSSRGRAVWYDASGIRRQKLLPGRYGSQESRSAFARLQLELTAAPTATVCDRDGLTIAELLCRYLDHAERHYRLPDGTPTSEVYEVRVVIRALRELYPDTPVAEFGPLALKTARQRWVSDGRSRTECNRRVGMVKRIMKWAVAEELAPPAVYHALSAVAGLQKGRTPAPECVPVGPVDDAVVDATLPFLNRYVRGLVEFQRLTGCRPGEACALRRCDLDMTGSVWFYRPPHHKNAWRGKGRVVAVGPRAQELVRAYFTANAEDHLFSPRRAVAEHLAERATNRKTPRWTSHLKRNAAKRKTNPGRRPAETYDRGSYGQALDRACDRAFPPPAPLAQREDETHATWQARLTPAERDELKAWQKAHRWSPNRLRHTFATTVRKRHGIEAAQVLLGHAKADVTEVYAQRDAELAVRIAAKFG